MRLCNMRGVLESCLGKFHILCQKKCQNVCKTYIKIKRLLTIFDILLGHLISFILFKLHLISYRFTWECC